MTRNLWIANHCNTEIEAVSFGGARPDDYKCPTCKTPMRWRLIVQIEEPEPPVPTPLETIPAQ